MITFNYGGTVSHYGGHCSFWYSTDDDTFTKIADVKDCTLHPDSVANGDNNPNTVGTVVQLPEWMPTECETKCTFAWTWVPTVSGACEVYSNCADIQVTGLSGMENPDPQTSNFQTIIDDELCERVKYVLCR